jgi:RHS repeat-associated protein
MFKNAKSLTKTMILAVLLLGPVFTSTVKGNLPPKPDPEKENPKWVWKIIKKATACCKAVWGWKDECVQLKVSFGKTVNQPLLPQSYFLLRHSRPSPTITSPQGLYFSSPFSSYMLPPETVGNDVKIEIIKEDGFRIKFQIDTGESSGVPCDEYAGTPTRIKMLAQDGTTAVLVPNTPYYYEIDFGDGVTSRYLASSRKVDSITTAEGVVLAQDDKGIGQEVIRDEGHLRQVWSAADGLADIVTMGAYKYEIRLYAHGEFGAKSGDLYSVVGGTAHTIWTIENPNESDQQLDQIKFTKTVGAVSTVANWQYNSNNDSWALDDAGLQKTLKTRQWDLPNKVNLLITELIKESDDTIRSKTTQNLHKYSSPLIGTVTTQKSVYIDANNKLDTDTSYYDDISSTSLKYGQIKLVEHPNGGWEKFDYDSLGRKNSIIKPLKNAVSTAGSGIRTTTKAFTSHDNDDTPLANDTRPRTVEEKIDTTTVKKTYYVYKTVSNEEVKITEIAGTPTAAYGTASNLRTTKVHYASTVGAPAGGKVKSITYPDGRLDSISYEYGNISNPGTPDQVSFSADVDGSATRITTIHGTTSSTAGVAYKTTKDIKVINATGDTVLEESYAYDGTNYNRVAWVYMVYNDDHKVTSKYASNNTQVDTTWNCCNMDSNTTADGTEYTYGYDVLKRMTNRTKKGVSGSTPDIVTTYTYDAAGNKLSESTTDGTNTLAASKTYDWSGRVLTSTDVSGLVTSYVYTKATSSVGDIVTITYPDSSTKITEQYFDGRIKSITGTSVVAKYYDYGVDTGNGNLWSKESIGSAASTRYTKTYTNSIGKIAKIEKSGYNTATITTEFYYNNYGQLWKKTQTGLADTLYEYDSVGNMTRSGLDISDNGTLDLASADRISDRDTVFSLVSTDWWQITTNKTYATTDSSTSTTTSITKKRLTGLASGTISETKTTDIHGNETVATTTVNRATKTLTQTVDVPNSSIDGQTIKVNGLVTSSRSTSNLTTTIAYDGLGRRTSVTDPRTGSASTVYYTAGAGKIGKVYTVTDAASKVTTYDYNTTTGRLAWVQNALSKKTYYDYNDRGQITNVWGDTGYPIEKAYDIYGQNTTLKTYRAGTGWTGSTWPTATTGTADTTTWAYDASSGLVTSKTFADSNAVTYTYTSFGKLYVRTWDRTSGGNPLTTTYSYDANTGEQTGINYSDATQDIAFIYKRTGQKYQVSDAVGTRTFAYNSALQESTETIAAGLYGKVLTRNYSSSGYLGRYTGVNISAEYVKTLGYDAYGRQNTVSDGTDTFTYAYLASSDLVSGVTRPNNLTTDYSYEANRNLMTVVENKYNATTISAYTYRYDNVGKRNDVVNTGTAFAASNLINWTYNDRSELLTAKKYNSTNPDSPTNAVTAYDYALAFDNIGNRSSYNTSTGGTATTYTLNNLNQYTAAANPTLSLTYDTDGNMLTAGSANGTWNGENRLIEIYDDTTGKKLEFVYDYMGRRVEKKSYTGSSTTSWTLSTHEKFVYDGYKCIEVLDGANSNAILQKFLWSNVDFDMPLSVYDTAATATYYYFADANKNIGQLMDSSGNIVAKYKYSPFGVQTSSTGAYAATNPFCFSSEYYDSITGLVYYNYRYYSPTLGRWLSRDPIEEEGGWNLYGMVNNNPIDYWDELGHGVLDIPGAPGGPASYPSDVTDDGITMPTLEASQGMYNGTRGGGYTLAFMAFETTILANGCKETCLHLTTTFVGVGVTGTGTLDGKKSSPVNVSVGLSKYTAIGTDFNGTNTVSGGFGWPPLPITISVRLTCTLSGTDKDGCPCK